MDVEEGKGEIFINPKNTLNFLNFQEYLIMMPITIYFPKGSFLVNPVNEKLLQFRASGLSTHFEKEMDRMLAVNILDRNSVKRAIPFRYISGCFQIWLALVITAGIIFVIEVIWGLRKRRGGN